MERNRAALLICHVHILEREPGDYPFRDGRITVTFAEIATWKNRPGVLFQLMRKYPLQGAFSYALGKQIDEKEVRAYSDLIYESSNGDSWSLTRDPATGARAVMQTRGPPNSKIVECVWFAA
jgi:hypothetical protein